MKDNPSLNSEDNGCLYHGLISEVGRKFYWQINDAKDRQPIPKKQLEALQDRCRHLDDDVRWLVALICDSGMRLAEAAGLAKADFKLNHKTPHIDLKPHKL